MAMTGIALELLGFVSAVVAVALRSPGGMLAAITATVAGFAFINPSLNGLLSRRTDPHLQGSVLGVGQGASALARILGAAVGPPLVLRHPQWPPILAGVLMAIAALLVLWSGRRGGDYGADAGKTV